MDALVLHPLGMTPRKRKLKYGQDLDAQVSVAFG